MLLYVSYTSIKAIKTLFKNIFIWLKKQQVNIEKLVLFHQMSRPPNTPSLYPKVTTIPSDFMHTPLHWHSYMDIYIGICTQMHMYTLFMYK